MNRRELALFNQYNIHATAETKLAILNHLIVTINKIEVLKEIKNKLANYNNYDDLKHSELKQGDKVNFTVKGCTYNYTVETSYLESYTHGNDKIFHVLGMSKQHVAERVYGYASSPGGWPQCEHRDYYALTKLVLYLFEYCDNKDGSTKEREPIGKEIADAIEARDKDYKSHYSYNDKISFLYKGVCYNYDVDSRHLAGTSSTDNNGIWRALGITTYSQATKFILDLGICSRDDIFSSYEFAVFNYSDYDSKNNDYLNAVIKALIKRIKEESTKIINHKSKSKHECDSKCIIVPVPVTTIRRGETIRGRTISGRADKITITLARISNKAIVDQG